MMDQRPEGPRPALPPSRAVAIGRRIFHRVLMRTGFAGDVEIPGRRTGAPLRNTLAVWQVDGKRYLMSQYGLTEWVRNLRAAGGGQLHLKGRSQAFSATEVEGEERDRVIALFRSKADKLLRRDFDRLPDPADHPTFRVETIDS